MFSMTEVMTSLSTSLLIFLAIELMEDLHMQDPTEFRKRFLLYKEGKMPYENGRPKAIQKVDESNADFAKRLRSNWRLEIWDWKRSGKSVTHRVAGVDNIVYPEVQTTKGGGLIDFTHPIWKGNVDPYKRAIKNNDYVSMDSEQDAIWFGPNYKDYYPGFKNGKLPGYKGGKPENGGVRYNPIYPVEKPLTPNQQYIQGDDGSWIRLTNPGMEAVVTARRPNVESDRQYTARRIAETQPERTWLSDAADMAHMVKETAMALDPYTAVPYFGARVGEDILNDNVGLNTALNGIFAITPFKQLPLFILTPITDTAKGVVYGSKKLADGLGFFVLKPGTYTRGIGITDAGVRDAIETGVFRGNPRGTEQTAKVFDKMFLKNRNNFRDIVKDTGIDGIESRYQSRTLTEEDFNALKLASKKYDRTDILKLGISLLPLSSDPLYKYKNYLEYLDDVLKTVRETNKMPRRIASGEIEVNNNLTNPIWFEDESGKMFLPQGRPINKRFGPNSDYVSDGNPLSYWYGDGRNAITDGHAYARSNYMVRVNNPQDYIPFMHELHMHPSFFKTPKLSDPNVELFRRGPFGITIRMRKPKQITE